MAVTFVSGMLMGSADVVPGVSGGTVALVLGIYDRLVANIRQGAHALSLAVRGRIGDAGRALRHVEWSFLVTLIAGILTAVGLLASGLEHLLENEPVALSAAFAGLVIGSLVVAFDEFEERSPRHLLILVLSGATTFLLLGLRTGRFDDPGLLLLFVGGVLAITAMILPGISGSFILLMIGLYESVLGAVNDRDLLALAVLALGAAVGLGSFSTLLDWLLRRYRDVLLAVLIGLMAGSLRVLWPWPAGEDGVGDTTLGKPVAGDVPLAVVLALVAGTAVIVIARLARRLSDASDQTALVQTEDP